VRIVAPIPGKAVVGVEVPNKKRETVYLKEILDDDCFTRAASKLQVGLGKDIKGAPVSVNLAKMPHLPGGRHHRARASRWRSTR
jgi:S-DNA-T family DNA segregation ATPase FtsK/SpoIIIE